jgi:hypothetical protein
MNEHYRKHHEEAEKELANGSPGEFLDWVEEGMHEEFPHLFTPYPPDVIPSGCPEDEDDDDE